MSARRTVVTLGVLLLAVSVRFHQSNAILAQTAPAGPQIEGLSISTGLPTGSEGRIENSSSSRDRDGAIEQRKQLPTESADGVWVGSEVAKPLSRDAEGSRIRDTRSFRL